MVVGMNLTIHGVGFDIKGHHLEGVGMHKEGVPLGVVDSHGAVGTHGIAGILIVLTVVAGELVLVRGVDIDHIAEGLTHALLTVVPHAITRQHFTLVRENRTLHEAGLFILRVVVALLRVYMTVARIDIGGTHDMSHRQTGIIIKSIGSKIKLRRAHLHVVVEYRHLRLRVIFTPVGG